MNYIIIYHSILHNNYYQEMTSDISSKLKIREGNGNSYTWSFHAFKSWKKKFRENYQQEHGRNFKEDVPNPKDREGIYKNLLGMNGIDVFESGNISHKIDSDIFTRAQSVINILRV